MAFLSENPVWEAGVRRIEENDPVLGGEVVNPDTGQGGAANIANLQITNRLAWLKQMLDGRYTNAQVDTAIAAAIGVLTAAEILTRVKTVDGTGSGLDADLLDGQHASAFWQASAAPSSLGTNGYQQLPSGLILQWGASEASTVTGPYTLFPIAFPTSCYQVLAVDAAANPDIGNAQIISVLNVERTRFRAFSLNSDNGNSPATAIRYFATGV